MSMKGIAAVAAAVAAMAVCGLDAPGVRKDPATPERAVRYGRREAGRQPRTEAAKFAAMSEEERAKRREEARQKVMEMHGGIVDRAGEGAIAVVNCQTRADISAIGGKVDDLRRMTHMVVEMREGTFDLRAAALPPGVSAAVFVVDDPGLPASLVAVEAKWGVVNVSPLLSGDPDKATAAKRFTKEFVRVASLTFGGGGSQYSGSPLQPVFGVADLDAVMGEGFTVDVTGAMARNLRAMGMKAARRATYRKACEEGWAPAPTNSHQKAVWEQVKADKERGPSNPVTINPPRK